MDVVFHARLFVQEWTPLFTACGNGKLEAAQWLVSHGADLLHQDDVSSVCMEFCVLVHSVEL